MGPIGRAWSLFFDRTSYAVDGVLGVYARATFARSVDGLLVVRPTRPVLGRR